MRPVPRLLLNPRATPITGTITTTATVPSLMAPAVAISATRVVTTFAFPPPPATQRGAAAKQGVLVRQGIN